MNESFENCSPLDPKAQVSVKINHPKLVNFLFTFPSHCQFQEVLSQISRHCLLKLFTNYYVEHQGRPVHPKKTLQELVLDNSNQVELDLVFQYYTSASALHHFEMVSSVLKNPFKLAIIMRSDQKQTGNFIVDPEGLGNEMLPHHFKMNKSCIEDIVAPLYQQELWQHKVKQKLELVQFLGMSGFHPPIQAQLSGDLFYLHAKTLQNVDLHITASPLGFYLNQSKINNYNPTPLPGRPVFTSLLDLLSHSSERFHSAFLRLLNPDEQPLLDRIAHREDSLLKYVDKNTGDWLDSLDQEHQWNMRKDPSFKEMDKAVISIEDWNQTFLEIQRRSELLKQEGVRDNSIWENDSLRHAYRIFEEAAVEGAKKIVEGKIQAMNHSDEKKKHIYVHNRIFFSITQDTPLNHILDKGEEMIPTGSSSNTDLIQLERLIAIRPANLHLLHTVLIFYRGYRVIAQTILPGLLSSELSSLTQYGSVDDNKSINNNQEFHKLLLPICDKFHLDSHVEALDKDDKLVPVAISPEVKGISSSNGEKYLCDLQRIAPRDLNYLGTDNEGCVLRHELIQAYIQQKGKNAIFSVNPNVATSIRFKATDKTEKQEQQLKRMAVYLQDQALNKLTQALKSKNSGDYLTDSQGLSKVFHSHGVNMRYLGKVYNHEQLQDSIEVKICLCRGILVRSLKHLFRKALREVSPLQLSVSIAHMLNCVFARKNQLDHLGQIQEIEERQETLVEPKRKKKKKQKEDQPKNVMQEESKIIKIENSKYQNIRSQDLWAEICHIAKVRFDHCLQTTIQEFNAVGLFRMSYQKHAVLRDLCLCVGLVLEKRNYNLKETDNEENLPFSSKHIIGFSSKTKVPIVLPPPEIERAVSVADRFFSQNQLTDAMKAYQQSCVMIRERGEGSSLSHCLGQISRIHYIMGCFKEAFNTQAGNLAFILKTFREDSFEAIKCYSRLGLYCMSLGVWQTALWLLGRGLNLMLLCFGEAYSDVLINFANIARVYQLSRETQQASSCYIKAIEMLNQIHGTKAHINTSFCFSSLASIYYEIGQYRKSVEYQNEAVSILSKILHSDDPRNKDAQKILKVYKQIHTQNQPRSSIDYRQRRK